MENLVTLKFSQEFFKTKLLKTNNIPIIEGNYWKDSYWGVDLNLKSGQNILGQIIMNFRNYLQNFNPNVKFQSLNFNYNFIYKLLDNNTLTISEIPNLLEF